jgi:hypothetical protein
VQPLRQRGVDLGQQLVLRNAQLGHRRCKSACGGRESAAEELDAARARACWPLGRGKVVEMIARTYGRRTIQKSELVGYVAAAPCSISTLPAGAAPADLRAGSPDRQKATWDCSPGDSKQVSHYDHREISTSRRAFRLSWAGCRQARITTPGQPGPARPPCTARAQIGCK